MLTADAQSKFRPRRRHRKSRNGCMECKRRRIKCDEMKPSCSRCVLTRQPCIWPPASQSSIEDDAQLQPEGLSLTLPTPSPRTQSPSRSSSMEAPRLSPPVFAGSSSPPSQYFDFDLTDTGLYHHYLQHTSRNLTQNAKDLYALQIGLPTLALRSKTIFHSILAVSAACMCCDMIARENPPDVNIVHQVLMTGYHHYNAASEKIRELISKPTAAKAGPLLAAPPLLVPFATSSQQINHWISSNMIGPQPLKRLSTTPRDVIIITRGIRATLIALKSGDISPSTSPSPATPQPFEDLEVDDDPPSLIDPSMPPSPIPLSHSHPMYPIIASTSAAAFSKLQDRLDSAILYSPTQNDDLSACAAAFNVLSDIRSGTFSPSLQILFQNTSISDPPVITHPHIPQWLLTLTARPDPPSPTEPLTRPFLNFLVQVPQSYLDLLLPLLDQRLETPLSPQGHPLPPELSQEQALALDIYAHWSVLMLLVEEESWWIGKLADVTLAGMLNRFGSDFVSRIWPGETAINISIASGAAVGGEEGGEGWWPRSMLGVSREIGRFR
ncbi:hypothetical protein BJY04DRAFT_216709 [Aspergillus karnatakaensis]|uniref:Zn(II)2Cys6 transcription factor n=1 Tax=Aspergillus karnatakaensis TaxID=1810916 RepID=UPI003CCD681A